MKSLLQITGMLFFGLGLGALLNDVLKDAADPGQFTDLGSWWYWLDPGSLNFVQAITQRYVAPWVWDPGITWVLLQPAFAVLMIFGGAIFTISTRIKTKKIKSI